MKAHILLLAVLLAGCGSGSPKGDTNITCINSQPVVITLPDGQIPNVSGDGAVVGDVTNPDGTHTFTISGCNFDITGDTNVNDNHANNSNQSNTSN